MRSIVACGALVILLGVALVAPAARAADDPGWGYDLSNHLMSPFCPGRTLPDCPSEQASELRSWIIDQERAGRTRADVEQQLYGQFGDVILQTPRATGFGLAAYAIPVLLFLAGGALLAFFLRRQTRTAEAAPPPLRSVDPELERLVDAELRDAGPGR